MLLNHHRNRTRARARLLSVLSGCQDRAVLVQQGQGIDRTDPARLDQAFPRDRINAVLESDDAVTIELKCFRGFLDAIAESDAQQSVNADCKAADLPFDLVLQSSFSCAFGVRE